MYAMPLVLGVLACLAVAYRYYSAFLAARVAVLDDSRPTPAHQFNDGQNYHPTHKWVLFGHHFAAISGAGPLIGPVLAVQFGYLPGLIWIVVGVCLAGAVQDMLVLAASVRHRGRSLAEIARAEIGRTAGTTASIAILFVVVVALAGLGIIVVKALGGEDVKLPTGETIQVPGSAWGTFTIACTIPIALFVGWYMYRIRKGRIVEASAIGAAAVLAATVAGKWVADSSWAGHFQLSRESTIVAICVYGFIASVLPVWMLLCPRDYLSSFLKIGTVALLVLGVIVANPPMQAPAVNDVFSGGGGPNMPGALFPFCFICIMCGAISGFHALVASGTTPKMISQESHIRTIGYGAMLIEGLVGVMALIAAATLPPGDYYGINVPLERKAEYQTKLEQLQADTDNLDEIGRQMGNEFLRGRTGGAVTLAVGMAEVFTQAGQKVAGDRINIEGVKQYWYHFAIMFEALFILTTIDTGTRIARFLLQEVLGKIYKPFDRADWVPGAILSTAAVTAAWGALIWTGSIDTIWPMFGIANQTLAALALTVVTTWIINRGRGRYAWLTILPLAFVCTTTMTAAYQLLTGQFHQFIVDGWHLSNRALLARGLMNTGLTILIVGSLVVVLSQAIVRWIAPSPSRQGPQ